MDKYKKLKEAETLFKDKISLVKHTSVQKFKRIMKETNQLEEQNKLILTQIETQDDIISNQLLQIDHLLREENQY